MVGDEGGAEADSCRQDNDPDQLSAAPALCKMQKLHHTRHVVRTQQINRK